MTEVIRPFIDFQVRQSDHVDARVYCGVCARILYRFDYGRGQDAETVLRADDREYLEAKADEHITSNPEHWVQFVIYQNTN